MAVTRKHNGKGSDHVEKRVAALREDIDAIRNDVKGLGEGVGEVGLEQADGAQSYVNVALGDAQSYAQQRMSDAQKYAQIRLTKALKDAEDMVDRLSGEVEEWAADGVENTRETIRNQPLAACVLSMSAGALIGALLLRR